MAIKDRRPETDHVSSGIKGAGTVLARLREGAGYSVTELAERVGTSKSAISQLENDRRPLSIAMLEKLAKALEWRPEAFILFILQAKYKALVRPDVLEELKELKAVVEDAVQERKRNQTASRKSR